MTSFSKVEMSGFSRSASLGCSFSGIRGQQDVDSRVSELSPQELD